MKGKEQSRWARLKLAARLLQVDRFTIYRAIWRGDIHAIKRQGLWFISIAELRRWQARKRRR